MTFLNPTQVSVPIGQTIEVVFSVNQNNVDLATAAQAAGWDGTSVVTINATVNPGVLIGSSSSTAPIVASFTVGTFPAGTTILLTNNGTIQGAGGDGGTGGGQSVTTGFPGDPGGTALLVSHAMTLDNANGEILGGGGGGAGGRNFDGMSGAGGSGGGGAGTVPGAGGPNTGGGPGATEGDDGTATTGGLGGGTVGNAEGGGTGGNPGLPGDSTSNAGGDAGNAIDGVSNVTITGAGTITGPQVG